MRKSQIKTTIKQDEHGAVILRYAPYYQDGSARVREFHAPRHDVGYVTEYIGAHGVEHIQVCERLSRTGSTLRATTSTLPAVIRREYRAMRRAEARN